MRAGLITAARRQVADHLAAVAGMEMRTLDAGRLQWVIDARCRALGLRDATAYADRLAAVPEETEALIDETIVPETRFFRDANVFEHLRRWLPQLSAASPGPLRVLSAPCSTGQEAYSLAATLQAAGRRAQDFSITAVDVSGAALACAERGIYPENALRGVSVERQNACGQWDGQRWTMHAALRRRIHFKRRNLAEPGALAGERYHLILCRNLFIYLRPEARRALAQSLSTALLPGGRLILGTADHGAELNAFFAPLKPAASFAYTHRAPEATEVPAVSSKVAAALLEHRPHQSQAKEPSSQTGKEKGPSAATFYRAADERRQQGDLAQAEHRCRQALYLDPGFLPALELLETLWRNLPDQRLRLALAARIQRNRTTSSDRAAAEGAS